MEKEYDTENEIAVANQLALEQALYSARQQVADLANEGKRYKHPSYIKYLVVLLGLAIIVDGLDFMDLSGILAILGRFISFFAWGVMILIYWFTNTKHKNAKEYTKTIEEKLKRVQGNVAHLTRLTMRTTKILRRIPGMGKIASRITRGLVKIRRIARKNPLTNILVGGAINLIPFLALVPWMIVGVILAYMGEKKTYENAREAGESIENQYLNV